MTNIEHGNIFIGTGTTTKIPIYMSTKQGNILFSGRSGCGKTFTSKLITKRFAQNYPSAGIFVIDPMNEYNDIVNDCGLYAISIDDKVVKISDKSVVAIKNRRSGTNIHQELVANALESVWEHVRKMPQSTLKLIVLDEAWILHNNQKGTDIIETLLKAGKHLNILFLASVHSAKNIESDLTNTFGTHIFMKLSESPTESVVTELPVVDQRRLAKLPDRCGLLSNDDQRIYVHFE